MIVYSASGAISPAIDRTKRYLFSQFRFWTFLKLCLVAVLTDGSGSSFSGNFPVTNQRSSHSFLALPSSAADFGVLVILPAALLGLALVLWLWYLIVRLRFAYFHCLVHQIKEITPGWRLYAQPAMRMFKLQLIASLVFLAAIAVVAGPFFFIFRGAFTSGVQPSIASILLAIAVLFPFLLAITFAGITFEIVTHDFMMPHMALEDMTVGHAWRVSRARYLTEKGSFWFYGFLRIVMMMVAGLAALMIFIIPLLIVGLLFLGIYVAVQSALADATGFAAFWREFIEVLLIVVGVALAILLSICVGGPIATWKRHYALLFYGGRFPTLGDLLSPPPPPPPPSFEPPVAGAIFS